MAPWTTPIDWGTKTGTVIGAADLNAQLRDNLNAIGAAWTSYVPTWSAATTAPAIGNGTITGHYIAAGKLVVVRVVINPGTTTTQGSGAQSVSLPPGLVGGSSATEQDLIAKLWTGTVTYLGDAYISAGGSTANIMVPASSTASNLVGLSSTTPNVGTTGRLVIQGVYEAA